jgi:hypothetical protein
MAEVRVQALEAQLDIDSFMDPGSMAQAVSLELGDDEAGTVAPWPHDSWVELSAEPTGFVTLVAAEDDEMDGLLTRVEAALQRDDRWTVLSIRRRPVKPHESEFAMFLTDIYRARIR